MCRFPTKGMSATEANKLIGQYVDVKVEKALEWALEGKAVSL